MSRRWAVGGVVLLVLVGLLAWAWPWVTVGLKPDQGAALSAPLGDATLLPSSAASLGLAPLAAVRPQAAPPSAAALPTVSVGTEAGPPSADAELAHCQAQAAAATAAARLAPGQAAPDEPLPSVDADQLAAAWDDTRRRLLGSSQPRQQAAAWMMDRPAPGEAPIGAALPAPILEPLVTLALASADPIVLQWALRSCGPQGQDPACQGLSARVWAQAEPDNLMAWLEVLRHEPQAMDEAMQAMASARRVDSAWMRWVGLVLADLPPGLAPPVRMALLSRVIGLSMTEPMPAWLALGAACRDDALADARRRAQCGQIATLMAEQGRDLLSASLGQGIGKRLGWPPQRLRAHQALQAAATHQAMDWMAPGLAVHCQAALLAHRLLQMDRLGEMGMARQALMAASAAAAPRPVPP